MKTLEEGGTDNERAGDGWFKTTQWTAVLNARDGSSPNAEDSLAQLCKTYWQPLYYYVRRLGTSPSDAQDLTQEFFARLLQKDYLRAVHPDKGRFRSFLLTAFKRFLANEHDRATAARRGGGCTLIPLNFQDTENSFVSEPADAVSPDRAFDQRWAVTLLEQVMRGLHQEAITAGNEQLFLALKDLLAGDKSGDGYTELSARFQVSEGALRNTVYRLRQRYRELLREEIANTVDSPEAVDDEIRQLFATFG